MIAKTYFLADPLARQPCAPLPLGAIRPRGWLLEQLKIQATGLSGHLPSLWPEDVGENCAWLGGSGDGWERAPYYLDGLIPLAHLLGSRELLALAERYIEAILSSQHGDGSFGPENNDWWPRMIVCKALLQHHGATGDARILPFLLKYMAYQHEMLNRQPLREWAIPRAAEGALCALQVYALTERRFLLSLARKLLKQGFDWTAFFHSFPYSKDLKKTLPWEELRKLREHPANSDAAAYALSCYHQTHVVNLAMALKAPAIAYALDGGLKQYKAAKLGYERLMKGHGVAHGLFTGDEHLSGNLPSQGTETCAIVEAMFSAEINLSLLGDPFWGDLVEKTAYSALPAALTADMWGHQYDQQVNQVLVSDAQRDWYNNQSRSNLFGFEPNFGCCTANYHQGWPKFVASQWMEAAEGGLTAQGYAPCAVRWHINGRPVSLEVSGDYPFSGEVNIEFSKAGFMFPLCLRIPAWAKGAHCRVNGKEEGSPAVETYLKIQREWRAGDRIELSLPMRPRVSRWSRQSAAVERGPVLYALKVGENWIRDTERPGCPQCPDWAIESVTPWQFAIFPDEPIREIPGKAAPFGHGSPPRLIARAALLPSWRLQNNSAAPPPVLPTVSALDTVDVELVPYGDTAIRIAQFPVARTLPQTSLSEIESHSTCE